METYKIKVEGTSPLLMNRPNQFDIADKSKDMKRETRTVDEQAEEKLYVDANKTIYIPATWFQGTIVEGGKGKKMSGKGSSRANYSKVAGSCVEINPFEIVLTPQKWKTFSVLTVNPNTKGRNLTHRPMFDKWSVEFEATIDEEQIEPHVLKDIFDIAGKTVGVGDWRPSKKGRFGRFMVTSFEKKK